MTREEMIAALENIQRKDALMVEYRQRYAASLELPANEMSDEQIQDCIAVSLGVPLGTNFSDEQLALLQRHWEAEAGPRG